MCSVLPKNRNVANEQISSASIYYYDIIEKIDDKEQNHGKTRNFMDIKGHIK